MIKKVKEVIEYGDIVSVKFNKKSYKEEIEKEITDKTKLKQALDKLSQIEKDLVGLKAEVLVDGEEVSLLSFPEHKEWMERFVHNDNEFYFFTKDLKIVKKIDKIDKFFREFDMLVKSRIDNMIMKQNESINYWKEDIKQAFRSIDDYKKRIKEIEITNNAIKDKKPSNSIEKIYKNKRVEKIYIKGDNLYILTKPLTLKSLNDKDVVKDIKYVLEIRKNEGSISRIANVSTYHNDLRDNFPQHCCVSDSYIPCLGSVIGNTLKNVFYDLSAVISTCILFLEKPDYNTPYINEESFANYLRYNNEFVEEDLSKAFDREFLKTLR